jgi:hypothetical protein
MSSAIAAGVVDEGRARIEEIDGAAGPVGSSAR